MPERHIGILGATSLIGERLFPGLAAEGYQVTAYSRRIVACSSDGVDWKRVPESCFRNPTSQPSTLSGEGVIPLWICASPIWVLPEYFSWLQTQGAKRVVALSSTSRFTKIDSSDAGEQQIAQRLVKAERGLEAWAEDHGVALVILRPTLIYGLGSDRNIAEIARFIRRFGFFPLFGKAQGLRQPIHVDDVAGACIAALLTPDLPNRAYNISGGETLTYLEMLERVFEALGRPSRLLPVPLWLFRAAVILLRRLPRYRHWRASMAERMSQDLVFDHSDATRDLGFDPRSFRLNSEDVSA